MLAEMMIVGLGGFVGAVSRYGLSALVQRHVGDTFPAGTLVVNVLGCLFVGYVMTMIVDHPDLSPRVRLLVCVGFLGGLTTFSTLGWETVETARLHGLNLALASVAGNVVLGLLAVLLGRSLARLGAT